MCHDMTLQAVLRRVAAGTSTERDAAQLKRWIQPPVQEQVVKAYLTLSRHAHLARRWLAADLRQGLAQQLTADATAGDATDNP